jgi:AcrR family transcriptional regulator
VHEPGVPRSGRGAAPEDSAQSAPSPDHPTSRRARSRYLEVAADVASQVRPGTGRAYLAALVELADLGGHLGRPRTSLYRLWPSQHDFWSDLTLHLVFQNDYQKPDERLPWDESRQTVELPAQRDPAADSEVLRIGLTFIQDAVLDDPWVQVRASLLGYADVPGVAEARRQVEDRRIRHLGARVAGILSLGGRAIAPPLRAHDAAVALWCLGDGFAVLHRSQPEIGARTIPVDDGLGPRPWGLLAYAVRAVLAEMSVIGHEPEPAGPASGPSPSALYAAVSARWTPAQRDALDAATTLFLEGTRGRSLAGDGEEIRSLGHVTVAAVARAAGVSRRSIYNHWSSSDELRLDLLRWLLAAERRRYVAGLDRVLAAPSAEGADRTGAVVAALLVHPSPGRLPIPHLPLAFLAEADHPAVRATLERGYAETVAAVATRVERLWPRAGRASGAELDAETLAVVLVSLATGANRLLRIDPDALRGTGSARRPNVLVAALQGLLDHHPATG